MSTLVIVLMAAMAVPGNGPEMVSGELEQGLDLSGEWEGTLAYESKVNHVTLNDFTLVEFQWSRLSISNLKVQDEGQGRFHGIEGRFRYVGIYEWRGETLILCYREASKGRPTSFQARDAQYVLILHRVKPLK